MAVPLGAEINLALQTVTLLLLLIGLRYGVRTRRAISADAQPSRRIHMNIMTSAVVLSGIGLLSWMLPNFVLGWFYGSNTLGYGTGGVGSYFGEAGQAWPHAYLVAIHVGLGGTASALGAYLVLRMRWGRLPRFLAVRNYRAVMRFTWAIWFVNVFVGYAVFYFFAFARTA